MLSMFSITGYGLWEMVIANSMIFIIFAFSFFRPSTGRDWRTFGAFSAFIVALFTEMFGDQYARYMQSTPGFIPRIQLNAAAQRLG